MNNTKDKPKSFEFTSANVTSINTSKIIQYDEEEYKKETLAKKENYLETSSDHMDEGYAYNQRNSFDLPSKDSINSSRPSISWIQDFIQN